MLLFPTDVDCVGGDSSGDCADVCYLGEADAVWAYL